MIWFAVVVVMLAIGAAAVKIMLVYGDALDNVGPDDDYLPSLDTAETPGAVSDIARRYAAGTD